LANTEPPSYKNGKGYLTTVAEEDSYIKLQKLFFHHRQTVQFMTMNRTVLAGSDEISPV
jgi:hypothetical protein